MRESDLIEAKKKKRTKPHKSSQKLSYTLEELPKFIKALSSKSDNIKENVLDAMNLLEQYYNDYSNQNLKNQMKSYNLKNRDYIEKGLRTVDIKDKGSVSRGRPDLRLWFKIENGKIIFTDLRGH